MPTPINHQPWHGGGKVYDLLVRHNDQKTVKAECGTRVSVNRADPNSPITCPDCLRKMAAIAEALRAFK